MWSGGFPRFPGLDNILGCEPEIGGSGEEGDSVIPLRFTTAFDRVEGACDEAFYGGAKAVPFRFTVSRVRRFRRTWWEWTRPCAMRLRMSGAPLCSLFRRSGLSRVAAYLLRRTIQLHSRVARRRSEECGVRIALFQIDDLDGSSSGG